MLTLWFAYSLTHHDTLEGLIAHTHALCITTFAADHRLPLRKHDLLEGYQHLAITGSAQQLIVLLTCLTDHGICGLELTLPKRFDHTPFKSFGRGLTITRET